MSRCAARRAGATASRSWPSGRSRTCASTCRATEGDHEARYIEAVVDRVRVASVYVPNGTAVGSERFAFKLAFFDRLRSHVADLLEFEEPLVVGGDYNAAPFPIDVFDPQALDGTICYHPAERAKFRALLNLGLYDAFRIVEPRTRAYSWWDYQGRSWRANQGLRIDHLLLSRAGGGPARGLRDRSRAARRQGALRPRAGVVHARRGVSAAPRR